MFVAPIGRSLNTADRVTESSTTMNKENESYKRELLAQSGIEKRDPYSTTSGSDGNSIVNETFVCEKGPNFTSIRRSTELIAGIPTDCHE
jgi:hypothetical protein